MMKIYQKDKRDDIQILRAIAVLLVVFYHANLYFTGGFFGVDIFFVISGFVVSKSIWDDLESHNFTFRNFYLKRFNRLFPSLTIMLIFVLGLTIFSNDYFGFVQNTTKTAIASLTGFSNFAIYGISRNYFAQVSSQNPLLHTWSLAVEIQFYFLLPIILLFLYKFKIRKEKITYLIVFFIAISISLRLFIDFDKQIQFLMLPFRMWEFAIGILAFFVNTSSRINLKLTNKVFWFIIIFILVCTAKLDRWSNLNNILFYFILTGVFLICISENTMNRDGISRILIYLGKVSYAVYLFHWPLLVFSSRIFSNNFTRLVISITLTLLLAHYCTSKIEPLFVQKNTYKLFLFIIIFGLFSSNLVLGAKASSSLKELSEVFKSTKNSDFQVAGLTSLDDVATNKCQIKLISNLSCRTTGSFQESQILIIGDSHASHSLSGLHNIYPDKTMSLINTQIFHKPERDNVIMENLIYVLSNLSELKIVVISNYWKEFRINERSIKLLQQVPFKKTQFILIYGIPDFPFSSSQCLVGFKFTNFKNCNYQQDSTELVREKKVFKKLLMGHENWFALDVSNSFCKNKICSMLNSDRKNLYYDSNHLNGNGSIVIARLIQEEINSKSESKS